MPSTGSSSPDLTGLPDGIPYGTVPGNHDHGNAANSTTLYNTYFGLEHFSGRPWYGGHLGNDNQNHYDLLSAGGLDFIFLYLDFDYQYLDYTQIDPWSDGILKQYADRRAVVISHDLISTTGAQDPRGYAIYNNLKANDNLFLMLCGHNHGQYYRTRHQWHARRRHLPERLPGHGAGRQRLPAPLPVLALQQRHPRQHLLALARPVPGRFRQRPQPVQHPLPHGQRQAGLRRPRHRHHRLRRQRLAPLDQPRPGQQLRVVCDRQRRRQHRLAPRQHVHDRRPKQHGAGARTLLRPRVRQRAFPGAL